MYKIELTANFLAKQGLKSLVRETAKEVPLAPATGFETKLKLGFVFRDNQIKDTGWFFDSDDYQTHVDDLALLLENKKWTDYFEFRPTYELVAKWIFDTLRPDLPGLAYVALENKTIGVTTKYQLVDKN